MSNSTLTSELNILVVDDLRLNQLMLTAILEDIGHQVTCACNGEEAITKIDSEHYDLVYMDRHMPIMDGIEATRAIRKNGNPIPIIALTGSTDEEEKKVCLDAGMNDFIAKPVDLEELTRTLENIRANLL